MTVLETRELIIDIPERADGRPLSFRMEPGQTWGILGPNGAGKSTLLHTLGGLNQPRSGEVHIDGTSIQKLRRSTIAQQLGYVFQERQDGFPATVLETALIGRHPFLSPWQLEGGDDLAMAEKALDRLELRALENRPVSTLSGGERQRVALATALTQNPNIWLADEPTNHLDLRHQVAVMELLSEQAKAGSTVVMCLHDLNLAARWCDHLLLLYPNGEACWGESESMLQPGALENLYGQPLAKAEVDGAPVFVPSYK
ncbi:iron complex transport system ATP-binding protein [Halospina denitrificans]|uniref:Iron complex transport system ATP-binding protein n=1 Tax=Halospina denitrificans TaxID=332522 RepID=A0A4R7K1H9_9GAMM|nr:ABC transporter ATP-binding protein [Halospina denitrificans]TDT44425.1 iron complex transport system ATP-binding protein [Halospina denitrificans]